MAGEQVDIAGQFHPACSRCGQRWSRHSQARAHVQLRSAAEEVHVQLAATYFHLRVVTLERLQLRRVRARIGHGKAHALLRQEAHQGHAALAEADNDAELVGSDQ